MSSFWSCGLQVRVVDGPNKGRTYPLDAPEMTVGRAKSGGDRAPGWILIFDETVSRIHADLRWDEALEAYVLVNRSDTNPTKVNDAIVTENVVLKQGDQIRVGNSVLDLQGADFRFGGMKPPVARSRPATSGLPNQPNLQFVNPLNDGEKQVNTKKSPRLVALTTRPKLQFTAVHGPDKGQIWPISGMSLALGGLAPAESDESKPPAPEEGVASTIKVEKFSIKRSSSRMSKFPRKAFCSPGESWRGPLK